MAENYIIYALKSLSHNYIYIGQTKNLANRFKRHNNGHEKTTRHYRPFKIIYTERADNRLKARLREKFLKSGFGKEYLKNI